MEIEDIQQLLASEGLSKLKAQVEDEFRQPDVDKFLKEYDPIQHEIMSKVKCPDKEVVLDSGKTKEVKLTRIPLAFQQRIVSSAVSFLCGKPIELSCTPKDKIAEDLLAVVQKTWDDNKLKYLAKQIFRTTQVESHCAVLIYGEEGQPDYWDGTANQGKKSRFRTKLLSYQNGDLIYPIFNSKGDMVLFARGYKLRDEGKDVEHFDVHIADKDYYGTKGTIGWDVKTEDNPIGKIRAIYFPGRIPWAPVQPIIEHAELAHSVHGDTNLYSASPLLKAKGKINSFSQKGEAGAIIEMDADADLEYVTWVQSVQSIELEQKTLRSYILEMTDTVDMSPEQLKNLGPTSGVALEVRFLNSHLRCAENEETFGPGIQRLINFFIAANVSINSSLKSAAKMKIEPKFNYFLPKNDAEMVDLITSTKSNGYLSRKTAVQLNPLVTDPDLEEKELEREDEAAALQQQEEGLNTEFNSKP